MHTIDEVFDSIQTALDEKTIEQTIKSLEEITTFDDLQESWDNPRGEFVYAVIAWDLTDPEIADWRTYSAPPNQVVFIARTARAMWPQSDCPYFIAVSPLGWEHDEDNILRLTGFLKMMREKGLHFLDTNDDDDLTGV